MQLRFSSAWVARFFFFSALLLFPIAASSQLTTATIVGTVTDSTGATIPNVQVTITNLGTQESTTATSDSTGEYSARFLPPGSYKLHAVAPGFKGWDVPQVTLAVGDTLRLDAQLQVGEQTQTVEVTSAAPALHTEDATQGALVSQQAVADLPLNGRNFINLARLAPGASAEGQNQFGSVDDRRFSVAITINGQGKADFLLDGMDDNERFNAEVIIQPSIDAIQEMRILTNNYSAEFGRTYGGVINMVTKAGTNDFHGTLFEFLRNDDFDARNFFATAKVLPHKPSYHLNQFGGSAGGPIRKDKTFFFADYEGLRLVYGQTSTVNVPTAQQRAGEFTSPIYDPTSTAPDPAHPGQFTRNLLAPLGSNGYYNILSHANPIALNVLQLWPLPNGGTTNKYTQTANLTQSQYKLDARVDHRIDEANSVFGRFSTERTTTYVPSDMPVVTINGVAINPAGSGASGTAGQAGPNYMRMINASVNYDHTINSALVMELKAGYNRFANRSLSTNSGNLASQALGFSNVNFTTGVPGSSILDTSGLLQITGLSVQALGDSSYIPDIATNNIWQGYGSLVWVHGNHSVKFGGEVRSRLTSMFQSSAPKPIYTFDNTATNLPETGAGGDSFADFLLGYPSQWQRNEYLVTPTYRNVEIGTYVQDDWHATRKLTLNLGIRWDYYGPSTEKRNRIANFDFRHDVLLSSQVLVAGQNGVSKTGGVTNDMKDWQPRLGFADQITGHTVLRGGFGISFDPGSINTPWAFRNPPFISAITGAYVPALYSTYSVPYPTFGFSTPFGPLNPVSTNPALITGNLAPVDVGLRTPYTQQANLGVQQEFPSGFVLTVAYVGQFTRKLFSSFNVNQLNPGETVRPYASQFPDLGAGTITPFTNLVSASYNSLQVSAERRFKNHFGVQSTFVWEHEQSYQTGQARATLQNGNDGNDFPRRFTLAGNYELPLLSGENKLVQLAAGGWQVNGVFITRLGGWSTVTNQSPRTGLGTATSSTGGGGGVADRPNEVCNPNAGAQHTIAQWFNTSCFVGQTIGTYGNEGPGTVELPGVTTLDFSIFKNFAIRESVKLEFRAEAFNALNHPNFDAPNLALGNALYGQITTAANNLPRNIQFGLKLVF